MFGIMPLVALFISSWASLVDRRQDEILEHVPFGRVDDLLVDLDLQDLLLAVGGHLDHAPAGVCLDGLEFQLGLDPGHIFLHLLDLFHHSLHIGHTHGGTRILRV
jgi:hypothetical protein